VGLNCVRTQLQPFVATVARPALVLLGVIAQRDTAERDLAAALESLEARVRLRTHELAASNTELRRLAGYDPVTGVANRRRFDEALDKEGRGGGRGRPPPGGQPGGPGPLEAGQGNRRHPRR